MTFETPEVRHDFHQLPAALQVMFYSVWTQSAKQGYFLHITSVTDKGDVTLRLSSKPEVGTPIDSDAL